jgi:hypothetical protein
MGDTKQEIRQSALKINEGESRQLGQEGQRLRCRKLFINPLPRQNITYLDTAKKPERAEKVVSSFRIENAPKVDSRRCRTAQEASPVKASRTSCHARGCSQLQLKAMLSTEAFWCWTNIFVCVFSSTHWDGEPSALFRATQNGSLSQPLWIELHRLNYPPIQIQMFEFKMWKMMQALLPLVGLVTAAPKDFEVTSLPGWNGPLL